MFTGALLLLLAAALARSESIAAACGAIAVFGVGITTTVASFNAGRYRHYQLWLTNRDWWPVSSATTTHELFDVTISSFGRTILPASYPRPQELKQFGITRPGHPFPSHPILHIFNSFWRTRDDAVGRINGVPCRSGYLRIHHVAAARSFEFDGGYVAFQLPDIIGKRHTGVCVRQRSLSLAGTGYLGLLTELRELEFESIAMAEAVEVRVDKDNDDLETYSLFTPGLIAHLAETPTSWDQWGPYLLVLAPGLGRRDMTGRDWMCHCAGRIYAAYARRARQLQRELGEVS